MTIDNQVEIIEKQIHSGAFTLTEKLAYLDMFFGPDPEFTQEAIDIVIANICQTTSE